VTIWIITIEPHEQRYTSEWLVHLPKQIEQAVSAAGTDEPVGVIDGGQTGGVTTPGAFLDFAETNIFKSSQTASIARLFSEGQIKAGDRFLFTDAWHYGVIATRYMSDLLNLPVRLVSLWHAGQYDPHDFLGRLPDRTWARHVEKAIFSACDANVFATQFHIDLFKADHGDVDPSRICRAGWPMEYLRETLAPYGDVAKCNVILFPHRLAPEKQVEIFRELAGELPGYEFRVCQDEKLSKDEYHQLLAQAKLVFSASLQETLGIGLYEGLLCGAMPLAPDRLSYSEMYPEACLYPSEWTSDWTAFQRHKSDLVARINEALWFQRTFGRELPGVADKTSRAFFNGDELYRLLVCRGAAKNQCERQTLPGAQYVRAGHQRLH
jgi:hypothetical protein